MDIDVAALVRFLARRDFLEIFVGGSLFLILIIVIDRKLLGRKSR